MDPTLFLCGSARCSTTLLLTQLDDYLKDPAEKRSLMRDKKAARVSWYLRGSLVALENGVLYLHEALRTALFEQFSDDSGRSRFQCGAHVFTDHHLPPRFPSTVG